MLPIGDDNSDRTISPFVNYLLIAANVAVFVFFQGLGSNERFTYAFSTAAFGGNPYLPSLGASGAISGVLAGYLLLFPRRRVRVIVFRTVQEVTAIWAIGIWFAFQLISGLGMLGSKSQEGGVAYAAHIGGFIAGLVLVKLFAAGKPRYRFGEGPA